MPFAPAPHVVARLELDRIVCPPASGCDATDAGRAPRRRPHAHASTRAMATSHRLPDHRPEWIARIRAGDEVAFEALFRALAPGLCTLVTRYVGARPPAEELVQELFF